MSTVKRVVGICNFIEEMDENVATKYLGNLVTCLRIGCSEYFKWIFNLGLIVFGDFQI